MSNNYTYTSDTADWSLTKEEVAFLVALVASLEVNSGVPQIDAAVAKVKANVQVFPNGLVNTRSFKIV